MNEWESYLSKRLTDVSASIESLQQESKQTEFGADDNDNASLIERSMLLQQDIRRAVNEKKRIITAMQRVRSGDFGYCDDCGIDIPHARLQLDPAVATCVECQSALEHRQRHMRQQ